MRADEIVISVYVINGLLASLTGILYLARLNAADPTIKGTLTIDSLASALIGGIAFGGGKGSVINTIIGALVIMFIRNGKDECKDFFHFFLLLFCWLVGFFIHTAAL